MERHLKQYWDFLSEVFTLSFLSSFHLMLLVEDEFRADFFRCFASDGSNKGIEIRPIKLGHKSETIFLWRSEDKSAGCETVESLQP
jgi:hypothetical protein